LVAEAADTVHLALCLRGHAELALDAGTLRQRGQQLLAARLAGRAPRVRVSSCAEYLCLQLAPATLAELGEDRGMALLAALEADAPACLLAADTETLRVATRLRGELLDNQGCRLLRDAWSLELLARILDCRAHSARVALAPAERARIEQARALLLADFCHPPTIDALARATGLSAFRLKRGFHSLYGCGVHALFQATRMRHAWQLIASGAMDVSAAGIHVGYSNLSHFSDAFRRCHGMLPGELKRCAGTTPNAKHQGP